MLILSNTNFSSTLEIQQSNEGMGVMIDDLGMGVIKYEISILLVWNQRNSELLMSDWIVIIVCLIVFSSYFVSS